MIVQVEFDAFTRVFEHVKEQPLLLGSISERRFNAEPTRNSSIVKMQRPEPTKSSSYKMAELPVAG